MFTGKSKSPHRRYHSFDHSLSTMFVDDADLYTWPPLYPPRFLAWATFGVAFGWEVEISPTLD